MESEILSVLVNKLKEAGKTLHAAQSCLMVLKNNANGKFFDIQVGSQLFWEMRVEEVEKLRDEVEHILGKVEDMDDPDPAGIVSVQPWQDDFVEEAR